MGKRKGRGSLFKRGGDKSLIQTFSFSASCPFKAPKPTDFPKKSNGKKSQTTIFTMESIISSLVISTTTCLDLKKFVMLLDLTAGFGVEPT